MTLPDFDIEPYVGPLPLTFEMSSADVESIIGPAKYDRIMWSGHREEFRSFMNNYYALDDGKVEVVGFVPTPSLLFKGHRLFSIPDPIALLRQYDPDPYEDLGFTVFLKLGISITGFSETDSEGDKAITVFRKGAWDGVMGSPQIEKLPGDGTSDCAASKPKSKPKPKKKK